MPVRLDQIPAELQTLPQFVFWANTWIEKEQKWGKVPYMPNGRRASSTDPKTWVSFHNVLALAPLLQEFDGPGFVFTDEDPFIGIDLDDCRDPATGAISEPAASIIRRLDTYTEDSPSGCGVKLWVKAKLPDKCRKANHDTGVEVYGSRRFFTVTGHRVDGTPATINERQAEVEWLLKTWVVAQPRHELSGAKPGDDIEIARSALSALRGDRADGYDDWLRVGMSLKSVSDSLLSDWDSWSRQSSKYADGVCAHKWQSFNGHGVGLGTLIHWAKEDGWKPPKDVKATAPQSVKEAIAGLDDGLFQRVVINAVEITELKPGDDKPTRTIVPLTMEEIIQRTNKQTGDGIRRVDSALFVHDRQHGIGWLEKPQALMGWLARTVGKVAWYGGPAMVQQGQLFAEFQRTAPRYVSVESLPHEPPMAGHYCACREIAPGDGTALRWLLGRFCPATAIDGDLILSALLTPLWGGPPGCRPCYVITSDDGRGAGKSTLAELVGAVYDGVLQFSHLEDVATIKTRLLSPEALTRRVALIDNIKSHKFSWGELEGMITASTIGGRRLYVGEATRPNTLTWFLTLNGAALSCDMAQRAVIVKVSRPKRSATWYEETSNYIQQNQRAILGDLIAVLRGPVTPLREFSRWATWERDVLQRLPEPEDAQKTILERQGDVDVDREEADIIEEHFAEQLTRLHYDIDRERVFLPSQLTARWFGWATNQRDVSVISASRQLSQLATEGRLRRISIAKGRSGARGRGFYFTGDDWPGTHTAADVLDRISNRGAEQ